MNRKRMTPKKYIEIYSASLVDDIIPFWLQHSPDQEFGGYFTCLDRKGEVYDSDKFLWLQCREVWTFSMLYNNLEKNQAWLDLALLGANFLTRFGRNPGGHWYFSLTREGKPLIQPYNIFSDCFAAMAYGQLFKATGKELFADIAQETFHHILLRKANPKGEYDKSFPGTRPLDNFALPMILTNLVLEIEHILDHPMVESTINEGIETVMKKFYHPDLGVILENVKPDGSFSDSFEGRLVNPGHGLEAMWFIMDLAEKNNDQDLMEKAVNISLNLMEYGWDKDFGGIFYYRDVRNHPPLQLEWDQKLWWVHVEAMIAMLKGYLFCGEGKCWEWFEILHSYCFEHFMDSQYGEWFGYLNRKGEVLLPLKGGKWKGCFHVPRGFFQIWKTLERIEKKQERDAPTKE